MDNEIYVLFDAAENKYYMPLTFTNDAVAMRYFENEAVKPYSIYATHPQDFILYNIGTYYPLTGEIISHKPERVCSAKDFIRRKDNEI